MKRRKNLLREILETERKFAARQIETENKFAARQIETENKFATREATLKAEMQAELKVGLDLQRKGFQQYVKDLKAKGIRRRTKSRRRIKSRTQPPHSPVPNVNSHPQSLPDVSENKDEKKSNSLGFDPRLMGSRRRQPPNSSNNETTAMSSSSMTSGSSSTRSSSSSSTSSSTLEESTLPARVS